MALGVGLIIISAASREARASTLNPGETINIDGATVAETPGLAGTVLASAAIPSRLIGDPNSPFETPEVGGTVHETVVRESDSGTLALYYQVTLESNTTLVSPSFGVDTSHP